MTNLIFDRSFFWGWTMDPLRLGLTFWTTRYQLPGILSFTRWPRRRMAVKTLSFTLTGRRTAVGRRGTRRHHSGAECIRVYVCPCVYVCVVCVVCLHVSHPPACHWQPRHAHHHHHHHHHIYFTVTRKAQTHWTGYYKTAKQQKKVVKRKNTKSKK